MTTLAILPAAPSDKPATAERSTQPAPRAISARKPEDHPLLFLESRVLIVAVFSLKHAGGLQHTSIEGFVFTALACCSPTAGSQLAVDELSRASRPSALGPPPTLVVD